MLLASLRVDRNRVAAWLFTLALGLPACSSGVVEADARERPGTPLAGVDCVAAVTIVASSPVHPDAIALDDERVYWTGHGGLVLSAAREGGAVTVLAAGSGDPTSSTPSLALGAERVYWTDAAQGRIFGAPKTGGAAEVLAEEQQGIWGLALDDARLYWASQTTGTIRSVPEAGGEVVELAQVEPQPRWLAVDETHVYWQSIRGAADTRVVGRVSKSGGPAEVLHEATVVAEHASSQSLAVDDSSVYWAEPALRSVLRAAKADGAASILFASASTMPLGLTLAGGRLIFPVSDDSQPSWAVNALGTEGGGVHTIARVVPKEGFWFYPHAVAVRDGEVYWTDQNEQRVLKASCRE